MADNIASSTIFNYFRQFEIDDSHSPSNLFRFIVNAILINTVVLFGIFGNGISMLILSRPEMRSSINCLLIGLTICDTVFILTSVLLYGLPGIYLYTGYLDTYYYYVYPMISLFVYPFAMITQMASVYLTLTITLERYVAVCHPLRARFLCTYGRARWSIMIIIIFSFLYNLPRFWEYEIRYAISFSTESIRYYLEKTDLRNDPMYLMVYVHWLYLIFLYFLPFTALAILNSCIYKQVRKANAERQRLTVLQKRDIGLAMMLFCTVVVFFLCNIMPLFVNTIQAFLLYDFSEEFYVLIGTSNLLVTINNSVNFVIYIIFGEKFKHEFLKMCRTNSSLRSTGKEVQRKTII